MNQRPKHQKRPWWLQGQALVEFSLILPTLLFITLGIIDYGRILLVYSNASSAIRDASRNATLLGTDNATGKPFYVSCATIIDQGDDILFADLNDINILYYKAAELTDIAALDALKTAVENAVPNPAGADFDCKGTLNPLVTDGDVETGDIMVVTLDVDIEFITPILASLYPTLELDFRSQRTIVTRLSLVATGPDRDGDGILDGWEMYWFGCLLEDYAEEPTNASDTPQLAIRNDYRNRDAGISYLVQVSTSQYVADSWVLGTLPISIGTMDNPSTLTVDEGIPSTWNDNFSFPGNCATEDIDPVAAAYVWDTSVDLYPTWPNAFIDPVADDYDEQSNHLLPLGCTEDNSSGELMWVGCFVPNTFEFNATDDPDGDGCNNGCEEVRDLNPLEKDTGASDSDGDGLTDGEETGGFSVSARTLYDASCNAVAVGSETFYNLDPNEPDTDGDGLLDGDEVKGALNFNGSTVYTDPQDPDTDTDGILDGDELDSSVNSAYETNPTNADTDCDGIKDNVEISGFELTNLVINGVAVPRTVSTNPTQVDTDGDGFSDGAERDGTVMGTGTTYCNTGTNCFLDPAAIDTDNDGLTDNAELKIIASGGYNTDPRDTDTDNEGLRDGDEVTLYGTQPSLVNTDLDSCTAANGATGRTLNDKFESTGIYVDTSNLDPDGDGYKNGNDIDSDGDTTLGWAISVPLNDCNEVYYYGTNPYLQNTDGDLLADGRELELYCRDPKKPDDLEGDTCDSTSGDGDNLPDNWEYAKFGAGNLSEIDTGDPDGDGCDNLCEYSRRTEPLDPDTDDDDLWDGEESSYGTNPILADTDGDGLEDGEEVNGVSFTTTINGAVFTGYAGNLAKSDPLDPDTDSDGLNDYDESKNPSTPRTRFDVQDTDGDGLTDEEEVNGTAFNSTINDVIKNTPVLSDPLEIDGDFDGLKDFKEINTYGTYPLVADTDGDGIPDGTTASTPGEEDSDFDNLLTGWGTNPRDNDTDTDGVTDGVELVGINNYTMTVDGATVIVNLAGYGTSTNPKFAIFNSDTDSDGLSDGDEINIYHTNPLDADTDDDNILDGDDADPLVPDVAADTDLDGIPDNDETADVPPTDPLKYDSDGDGMGDGAEFFSNFTTSATGYNLSTNATFAISYGPESFQLDTTHQDSDGDGVKDGYDSDGDGLSDTFELYWYVAPNTIRATHPQFRTLGSGTFTGTGMEKCGFALTGTLPLHPDDSDTDNDGLLDGDECNVYGTNPFSAAAEGPIFDKVTNSTFLNSVVYPALEGNLALASASARALGYTLASDGLITLNIVRAVDPPNKRQIIPDATITTCGASAYTNASGVTTTFNCVAGVFVPSQPNKNNNDLTIPVVVRVPLARLFSILSDTTILNVTPG